MSDKMSEVEAAKKAVLARYPAAYVNENHENDCDNYWIFHRPYSGQPHIGWGVTEYDAWISAAIKLAPLTGCGCWGGIVCDKCKLAPLTEDAPKCEFCPHKLHEGACEAATDCLCVQYPSLRGVKVPASPAGELEGAFEAWWNPIKQNLYFLDDEEILRSTVSAKQGWDAHAALSSKPAPAEHENAFQYASEYAGVTWKQAASVACALTHKGFGFLIPKAAPEGIPERPIERRCDEGQHVYCSAAGTTRYAENVTAIISAKDAEIAELTKKFEHNGLLAMERRFRAEAAEALVAKRDADIAHRDTKALAFNEALDQAEAELTYLRASSAKVREEALREAVFAMQDTRCESLTRKDEGRIAKAILSLLPTSPESQEGN